MEVLAKIFQDGYLLTGFQIKFLILIEFPSHYILIDWKPAKKNQIRCGLGAKFGPNYVQCCEKSKETGNIIRFFFHILLGDYLLKQEAVVVKLPKWQFIAIIARNAKF